MNLPDHTQLFNVLEATWPAATRTRLGPWTIRCGANGGQRVSATTQEATFSAADIALAEHEMTAMGQPCLFMVRGKEAALDTALQNAGYVIKDPVTLYVCPIGLLTAQAAPAISAFDIWPPLEIMRNIWADGGINAGRLAVMDRVQGPKTGILSRQEGRAAGTAFVAIHREIAMLHAIEVLLTWRRKGAGINMMRASAAWAQDNGARYFSLVVTDANVAANALYRKLGMTVVDHYHYRIKQKH